ncbi:MAG: riboflavin synthase [Chloroflexi bacterium]|nr:riboflavin synthase [Chloroflexota bacterium]
MFTGIVEEVGSVQAIESGRLAISAERVLADLEVSHSICVNGACLTVTHRDDSSFSVDVVPETLRRTNLGSLSPGDVVNLERAMGVGDRFGGHVVQGHVDATGTVDAIESEGEALLVTFRAPESIMRYVVEKGFIAVDGTSLTVVNCDGQCFSVTIIPYTRENTVMGTLKTGDSVNLEADIMAKYVERLSSGGR